MLASNFARLVGNFENLCASLTEIQHNAIAAHNLLAFAHVSLQSFHEPTSGGKNTDGIGKIWML